MVSPVLFRDIKFFACYREVEMETTSSTNQDYYGNKEYDLNEQGMVVGNI